MRREAQSWSRRPSTTSAGRGKGSITPRLFPERLVKCRPKGARWHWGQGRKLHAAALSLSQIRICHASLQLFDAMVVYSRFLSLC